MTTKQPSVRPDTLVLPQPTPNSALRRCIATVPTSPATAFHALLRVQAFRGMNRQSQHCCEWPWDVGACLEQLLGSPSSTDSGQLVWL